eukprot:g13446.t1
MLNILARSLLAKNKNAASDFWFGKDSIDKKLGGGSNASWTAAAAAEASMAGVEKTVKGGGEVKGVPEDLMKVEMAEAVAVWQGLQEAVDSVENGNQVDANKNGGDGSRKKDMKGGQKKNKNGKKKTAKKGKDAKKKSDKVRIGLEEAEDDGDAAEILKDLANVEELRSKTQHSQKPFVWWMSSQASGESQEAESGGVKDDEKEIREAVDLYWQQAVPNAIEVDGFGDYSAILEWTMLDRHAESAETKSRAMPTEREYRLRFPGVLPKEAISDVKIPIAHKDVRAVRF